MNGPRISLLLVGLFIDGRQWTCGIWIKKSFYFVTLTPSQSGWKPLFIGGSVVRVRVRVWEQKWGKGRSIDNTTKKTKRFLVTKLWAPEQDDVTKKVYYRNVPLKVKISNDLFFHLNKILYFCSQWLTILSKESLLVCPHLWQWNQQAIHWFAEKHE